jgi:hypothetical protein
MAVTTPPESPDRPDPQAAVAVAYIGSFWLAPPPKPTSPAKSELAAASPAGRAK